MEKMSKKESEDSDFTVCVYVRARACVCGLRRGREGLYHEREKFCIYSRSWAFLSLTAMCPHHSAFGSNLQK